MQTDRNARRHNAVYKPIPPETSLLGNSNNNNLCLGAVDDCADIRVEMSNYDDTDEAALLQYNIAFLGSSKVGKTSIIQQFVHQEFHDEYMPSTSSAKYRKAAYMEGRVYDMTLRDCPGVASFPDDTVSEWSQYNGFYGLYLSQVSFSLV